MSPHFCQAPTPDYAGHSALCLWAYLGALLLTLLTLLLPPTPAAAPGPDAAGVAAVHPARVWGESVNE